MHDIIIYEVTSTIEEKTYHHLHQTSQDHQDYDQLNFNFDYNLCCHLLNCYRQIGYHQQVDFMLPDCCLRASIDPQ